MDIKTFTKDELDAILRKHTLWLIGDPNGSKADLYGANLSGAKNLICPITCPNVTEVFSKYNPSFVYRVGEIVSVDNFEPNRWKECAPGIHFFITRQEAVDY